MKSSLLHKNMNTSSHRKESGQSDSSDDASDVSFSTCSATTETPSCDSDFDYSPDTSDEYKVEVQPRKRGSFFNFMVAKAKNWKRGLKSKMASMVESSDGMQPPTGNQDLERLTSLIVPSPKCNCHLMDDQSDVCEIGSIQSEVSLGDCLSTEDLLAEYVHSMGDLTSMSSYKYEHLSTQAIAELVKSMENLARPDRETPEQLADGVYRSLMDVRGAIPLATVESALTLDQSQRKGDNSTTKYSLETTYLNQGRKNNIPSITLSSPVSEEELPPPPLSWTVEIHDKPLTPPKGEETILPAPNKRAPNLGQVHKHAAFSVSFDGRMSSEDSQSIDELDYDKTVEVKSSGMKRKGIADTLTSYFRRFPRAFSRRYSSKDDETNQ